MANPAEIPAMKDKQGNRLWLADTVRVHYPSGATSKATVTSLQGCILVRVWGESWDRSVPSQWVERLHSGDR